MDLNVDVVGPVATITWDPVQDQQHEVDFYLVQVYVNGTNRLLHSSFERDAQEHAVFHTTSELVVNVSTCNRCNQLSTAATMSFKGKCFIWR